MRVLWTAVLVLAALALSSVRAPGADGLRVAAYRVAAPDVDASAAFYSRHFGLAETARFPTGIVVLADEEGHALVLTPAARRLEAGIGAAGTRINFAVPDLDASLAALRDEGVEIVGVADSAVGRYATFVDPSGMTQNVKQRNEPGAPGIYNASVRVPDIARARAFYEGVLGLEAFSEDYYPPVVPMRAGGEVPFVLTDKTATAPAPYDHGAGVAWTGLAFDVEDLDGAVADLRARGVRFLADAPVTSGPVRVIAFADADGNVHELVEHTAPDGSRSPPDPGAPSDADLAFLAGTWRSESPDGAVVEEHWLEPSGGTISGVLRWTGPDGSVRLHEILTIRAEEGRGVFRWRHFDGGLTPWASEAEAPSIVTIDAFAGNVLVMSRHPGSAPSVSRMTYDGSTPGRLVATLEFDADSGRDPIVIEFERAE